MLNKSEFYNHLTEDLLPFWNNLRDERYGGFYGGADKDGNINKEAPKSAVLQTRILWFYSSCYMLLRDKKLLECASAQFEFIARCMLGPGDGGIYWALEHDGKVKDNRKHTYAQAFALYAFGAYYEAGGGKTALTAADKLFELIENNFRDEYGYTELYGFDRKNFKYCRTTNTLLHIIEAYTQYYQATKSEKARGALKYALNLVIDKVYNENLRRFECYYDELMNPVGDTLSYGHDIEASWLIYRACEVLGDDGLTKSLAPKLEKTAQNVISKGFADEGRNGVYYDCKEGVDNKTRSWWVMAEAVVALVHQYRLYGDEKSMLLAENIWNYIKTRFISPYGEWYASVDERGEAVKTPDSLCGPWKCPYHNGRMCLEIIKIL